MALIQWFDKLSKDDTATVGGKSANLGELARIGVPVLPGFATTTEAYEQFIDEAGIRSKLEDLLEQVDTSDMANLRETGEQIRALITNADLPAELVDEVKTFYQELGDKLGAENPAVAVRSSATAEDTEAASFAGQQDTYLDVTGVEDLLDAIKKCYASLFTDRAISYREDQGFSHLDVKLSCAVQKMGRSDIGSSGVMFTIDPDSGFEHVVAIDAAYGLGETVVQGQVNPDHYVVFKETDAIIEKTLGEKKQKLITKGRNHELVETSAEERSQYCLTDQQIKELAEYAEKIEEHYDRPMDVEWLLDGQLNKLYIVQARPETVHATGDTNTIHNYNLEEDGEILVRGAAIGSKIGQGTVKVLDSPEEIDQFEDGDVLVTDMTDPDWEPIMKIASAIVTNRGGRTSHAAIVSRELGIPAVVGTGNATAELDTGEEVTVDCSTGDGRVFAGLLQFTDETHDLEEVPETDTDVYINIGEPGQVFHHAQLPVDGVGLAREEFIISSYVGEHPLSLIERGAEQQFVDALKYGIGKIAAAFYPDPVIVRLSDFKTDEYADLKGGEKFEPDEANPMLGWRGASRYYDPNYRDAFHLECDALHAVINEMALDNVIPMVPFCRTVDEGRNVKQIMEEYGLTNTEFYVMAEVPSNIWLADQFADVFDGFSIGSNDLTQLTLGIDRNSEKLSDLFDERNEAVKRSIAHLIKVAHEHGNKVGICGDAPSTHETFAAFLVEEGIDSISVTPDVALKTILRVAEAEDN